MRGQSSYQIFGGHLARPRMKISHEQLLGTKLETASIDQEIDIKASRKCSRGFVEHP